jgi:DNA-binding response OmpR family regulator
MKTQVLIVDDRGDMRVMLKTALELEGFQVLEAATGQEALKVTRENQPDLILLDLKLPDISGLDVCAAVKNDPAVSRIPIIMLTASRETGQVSTCLGTGADDYVEKPYELPELMSRVRAVLRRTSEGAGHRGLLQRNGLTVDLGRRAVLAENRVMDDFTS